MELKRDFTDFKITVINIVKKTDDKVKNFGRKSESIKEMK